jgi:hypothetical protein
MRPVVVLSVALLFAGTAFAQQPGVPAPEAAAAAPAAGEPRVNQLIIYGEDPCPPGTNEEIIVCARLPEDDRFRIPPNLRNNPNDPANQSWANRAIELSYVGRTGTDSCSTVGGSGFTGCFNQIVTQARAERAGRDEVNWNQLIEQARRDRMRRIDEAEAEEAAEEQTPQ